MSAAIALQVAVRARLAASPVVTALVPANHIIDSHGRPTRFPCIILGEDQDVDAELSFERRHVRTYMTLHLWDQAPGLSSVKFMAASIREALKGELPELDGASLLDLRYSGAHFMRDPGGELSHGVATLEALVELPE